MWKTDMFKTLPFILHELEEDENVLKSLIFLNYFINNMAKIQPQTCFSSAFPVIFKSRLILKETKF